MLEALGTDLLAHPGEKLVVFLGDNIYPTGMPEADDPARAEAERRIDDQIRAAQECPLPPAVLASSRIARLEI